MARTAKKRTRVGRLSRLDLKELDALRKDPKRLARLLQKLRSRAELGIASKSEIDRLSMLEGFRERVRQDKADFKSRAKDYQKLHETFERDRARDAKRRRSDRSIPVDGTFRIVSGGAPGLGRRS
ncbi:hypothetical protein I0Q12_11095 [Rhodococcus sp. CX]|uniref:hypothetical protein n=1 Tax=Rhodococcus sp. CX TaxID=2789880 RepID=UPI0018CD6B4F|nr:hypothetical protein [Rhodococcus sp. CX]MBH0120030.1 hypothetical protein [Rhodococcus sp. CX]